jgi:hypothetical protein
VSDIPDIASYEIRPLSMPETLDAGFQLLKNHFVPLGALSAVGQIPTVIVFSVFGWLLDPFAIESGGFPEIGATFIVGMGLYLLAMLMLLPIVIGAITSAVGDLYLGVELSIGDCLRRGLARMIPLMVTYVIFSIVLVVAFGAIFLGVFFTIVGGAAALQDSALGIGLVIVSVLLGIPLFFAVSGLMTVLPGVLAAVVVLEGRSMFDAVARTFGLVTSQIGRLIGLGIVLWLFIGIVPAGVQLMVGSIPVLGAVAWGLVQALAQAYLYTTTVIAYFDVRCRLESFDLEHLAQLVEGNAPSAHSAR